MVADEIRKIREYLHNQCHPRRIKRFCVRQVFWFWLCQVRKHPYVIMKTLVVTGLFSPLGRSVAQWAADAGVRVLGLDAAPMARPIAGVEFVQTDSHNPLFARLLKAESVDAIFHGAVRWRVRRTQALFEHNVEGTARLLQAAADAGVARVTIPSSAFVYGAHPHNPPFMREEQDFAGRPHYAYVRDLRDIETFIAGFRQRHPQMLITMLRFANILGRGYRSPLARYLSQPVRPTLAGYNPLLQIIDFDDALRALTRALQESNAGVYNVAASPPLPLSRILALTPGASIAIPRSAAYAGRKLGGMITKKSKELLPIHWDYLRYSWTISTTKIEEDWRFTPEYNAESVLRRFARP